MQACPRMFQEGSLTLFRMRGVPVRAHWTLLLVLPYLAFALSIQFRSLADLAGVAPERLALPPLAWGLVLAVCLFASITLHELAHLVATTRFGGRVRSITLMLVGSVSQTVRIPQRPQDETIVAALGPVTSLTLGAGLALAYVEASAWPADLQLGLFYLAGMNLMLGVFNLIPALPMDGGRVLRAALAIKLGRGRATQIAASIGKACAIVLGGLGLWSGNLLLILIAVFVYTGARGELGQERVRDALLELGIVDLLPRVWRTPPIIHSHERASSVLPRMRELDRLELVVVGSTRTPVAVLQADVVASVSSGDPSSMTAGELASRLPVCHIAVPWDANANDAIESATEAGARYVIVFDPYAEYPNNLLGLIAADDIARMAKLRLARRPAHPSPAASLAMTGIALGRGRAAS